jgi:hypothetical protein
MIAEMDEYVENNVKSLESEYNDIIDKFGSRWNNGEASRYERDIGCILFYLWSSFCI